MFHIEFSVIFKFLKDVVTALCDSLMHNARVCSITFWCICMLVCAEYVWRGSFSSVDMWTIQRCVS